MVSENMRAGNFTEYFTREMVAVTVDPGPCPWIPGYAIPGYPEANVLRKYLDRSFEDDLSNDIFSDIFIFRIPMFDIQFNVNTYFYFIVTMVCISLLWLLLLWT